MPGAGSKRAHLARPGSSRSSSCGDLRGGVDVARRVGRGDGDEPLRAVVDRARSRRGKHLSGDLGPQADLRISDLARRRSQKRIAIASGQQMKK